MPGMLPVINKYCIEQALKSGIGLKAEINKYSVFDRKNYFYADLPQGYQISQYKYPIVGKGTVSIDLKNGTSKDIRIIRLHLEQDAGKSLHDQNPSKTYVDLNRSGVALMEIVSEPDLRSIEEVGLYISKIRSILMYLDTCDGNMQEGSLRADVNISVRKPGEEYGTRCEIKNLNSIKFIKQAINYEAKRQIDIIETGGTIEQNTLLFNTQTGKTRPMRSKEEAHDYRYFPEPDLVPVEISDEWIKETMSELPELPEKKRERFIQNYKIPEYDAGVLTASKEIADYYEKSASLYPEFKVISNWVMGELLRELKNDGQKINESPIKPEDLVELLKLIDKGTLSAKMAKTVFEEMYQSSKSAIEIVNKKGLAQITDSSTIENLVDEILQLNTDQVEQYRNGKEKVFGFLVGQIMKQSKGQADPALVNKLLKDRIN